MMEITKSPARKSPLWPISDESDDLETPLQVWQRLYGNHEAKVNQQTNVPCASNTTESAIAASDVSTHKYKEKQNCRRQFNFSETWAINHILSSESEEETEVKQTLCSKSSAPANQCLKCQNKNQNLTSIEDDFSVIKDEPYPPRTTIREAYFTKNF